MKRPSHPPSPELAYGLRQQRLLAEFGLYALQAPNVDALLQRATELGSKGLGAPLCKALELLPERDRLLVRAGVGWAAGVVGHATIGADLASPAGYALQTGQPVTSNHLAGETRFRTPELLADHGVARAVNVPIAGDNGPFGVLEVDTTSREGRFTEGDETFLQGLANVLGAAIERQKGESALRASEEQKRLIIEGAADTAIITMDLDGRITTWSPGAEAIFGWSEDEAVGQDASLIFTRDDRARGEHVKEMEAARRDGFARDERWHLHKDGGLVFMNGSMRPLHDSGGGQCGLLKVARDETERRRADDALRTSERDLRLEQDLFDAVIRQAPVGISVAFAEDGREAVLNDKAAALLGHTLPEGGTDRYKSFGALNAQGEPYAVDDYPTMRALRRGEVIQREGMRYRRGDGEIRRLEVSSAPVRDETGRIVAAVTLFTDVEEQRRSEDANVRLAAIVSASSDAIISFAAEDGRIMTWNKGAERLFGYTEAEAVGAPVSLLLPDTPEQRGPDQDRATGVFSTVMRHGRVEVESVRRHKDGTLIDVSITAARMDGPDGRVIGVSGIFRDIRTRKQAEALLREQVEQQKVLVREVSHRVKNSLAMVAGMLRLQSRAAGDPGARRVLEEAQGRVEMVAQVHDQLWRQEDVQSVDLAAFLGGLCARLQETAPAGHRVVWRLNPMVVPTDRAIPMGLLVNELVTNAFKYAYPDGAPVDGGEISVAVASARENGIRIEVSDQGVGLPEDFNPADRRGNSLGMRLIHGLARQLGAELEVTAAQPRGTRVRLDVPFG